MMSRGIQKDRRSNAFLLNDADKLKDADSGLYIDLYHDLPTAPQLDRIISTYSSRAEDRACRKLQQLPRQVRVKQHSR